MHRKTTHQPTPQTQHSPCRTEAWLDTKKASFLEVVAILNGFVVAVGVSVSGRVVVFFQAAKRI